VNRQLSQEGDETATLLLYAKWTDPILGCMAYFTRLRGAETGQDGEQESAEPLENDWVMHDAARNLNHYFGELADARVIYGLANSDQQEAILTELVMRNRVPVLAEGARRLAAFAEAQGLANSLVAQVARRLPIDQVWTVTPGA